MSNKKNVNSKKRQEYSKRNPRGKKHGGRTSIVRGSQPLVRPILPYKV